MKVFLLLIKKMTKKYLTWKTKDSWIIAWIIGSIDAQIVLNLKPYKSAHVIWEFLKKIRIQSNNAQRLQLEWQIFLRNLAQLKNFILTFLIFGLNAQKLSMLRFHLEVWKLCRLCMMSPGINSSWSCELSLNLSDQVLWIENLFQRWMIIWVSY